MTRSLSPVVLFVYNRADHTKITVDSLKNNLFSNESLLYVYSDGPKNDNDLPAINKVRNIVNNIKGFKEVIVRESYSNQGLAKSIISGVTEILEQHGRAIVIEDDLVFSEDFLQYMNSSLDYYQSNPKVMSIGGYSFPIQIDKSYYFDDYSSYRTVSWGWGTWLDAWKKADWEVKDFEKFKKNKTSVRLFDRGGSDLSRMLEQQMIDMIDSWSIRWDYTHFLNDAITILPSKTRVLNIGQDGSGTHCRSAKDANLELNRVMSEEIQHMTGIHLDNLIIKRIYNLHGNKLINATKFYIKKYLKGRK